MHSFMSTIYPFIIATSSIMHIYNAPCHKTLVISDWVHERGNEFSVLQWSPPVNMDHESMAKEENKENKQESNSIVC